MDTSGNTKMSIEQKAKAYDEALKHFKAFKEKYYTKDTNFGDVIFDKTGEMQKDFESIFPQLRESEDERIIRAIIDALYSHTNSINLLSSRGYQMENIEAWLEKQKYDRMKPIYDAKESFESALEKAWNDYHNGYENVDKLEDDYVECAHAKGFREGFLYGLEKQKEHHVPWYDYQKSKEAGYTIVPNEEYKQLIKQKERKPAEWSEEDEKMLSDLRNTLGCLMNAGAITFKTKKKFSNWLKSLRPQPKQEWSKEDKNVIETLIRELRLNAQFEFAVRKLGLDYVQTLTVLDKCRRLCPRPSWKPSYEQMEALQRTVNKLAKTDVADSVRLSIMYDNLKKL